MAREVAKELYLRWLQDVWGGDAPTIRKSIEELVTPDFVGHWPERQVNGAEELIEWWTKGVSFFDGLTATLAQGPIIDGDWISARWLMSGRYAGGLPDVGAPIGKLIRVYHVDILRIQDGKVAELWANSDQVEGLKQLQAAGYNGCQWFLDEAGTGA
ncbi:ester cyclase [Streptomyces sp. CHA1]|uniref:ester cyclase n=1 Tax=Streptomyces TaxID=1883 RepID=UPI001BFCAF71|nr:MULTISPECIES: ester cyclase [unclassified Streptomyces]MBT3160568.1 ester cyclase [Streptomyces sp. G11C]MCO6704253.1 ester cyclase [Streptomyces sp. CHB9.2]MCO6710526.1 ester cyclase [Streptomyces sp. CHA3]MCO6716322.1 ester cyclase [Streptomyces sp. CHB19.2]MCO6722452.1 ester cyclase [Streptomyces sp. Vc714c-19]